jgi:hypothetical protein
MSCSSKVVWFQWAWTFILSFLFFFLIYIFDILLDIIGSDLIEHNYILIFNVPLNHSFNFKKCILSSFLFYFFFLLCFKFFCFCINLLVHYLLFQNCQLLVYVVTCELEQLQVNCWHGFSLLTSEALKIYQPI